MNALTTILLLYILLEALLGCKRGFFRSVLSLLVLILTMIFAGKLSPQVANYLSKETALQETIAERIEGYLEKKEDASMDEVSVDGEAIKRASTDKISMDSDTPDNELEMEESPDAATTAHTSLGNPKESRSWQKDFLEHAGFPSYLSGILGDNNNAEFFEALKVDTFYPYIAAYLAAVIINILSYLVTFLVVWTILHIVSGLLKGIGRLPILRMLDRIGGMLFGTGKALLIVSLFLLLVTMLSTTDRGQVLVAQMEESPLLSAFYEHNPLIIFITDITKQIF